MNPSQEKSTTYGCKISGSPFVKIVIYTLVAYLKKKTLIRSSLHALTCAMLIDIRILGVLVPCLTLLFACADLMRSPTKKDIGTLAASLAVYMSLLVPLIILFWPFLWKDPSGNFIQAFVNMSKFKWDGTVLYMGDYVQAINLPWHYIPVWLLITTPIFYIFTFCVGLVVASKSIFKKSPIFSTRNELIFLLWFFLPLCAVIAFESVVYDAWRHMFFIYPAFLLIALRGTISCFAFFKTKFQGWTHKLANAIFATAIALSSLSTAHFMVENHPYQHVYFNLLAGRDMAFVKEHFELDYWGLSYRQALEYILENDSEETLEVFVSNRPGVYNSYILPAADRHRLRYVRNPYEAKYYVSNYRWHREDYSFGIEFYSTKVGGTNIMVSLRLP